MAELEKREKVYRTFEAISRNYDSANRRISLGMEKGWKRLLTDRLAAQAEGSALDVCCGTGDIAIALASARPDLQVVGLDFTSAMLAVAREKGRGLDNVTWQEGDAMALPFPDNRFSAASISFGLRNTVDYRQVLREMTRVVKPGGWVYCLDSFVPELPLIRPFYQLYFRGVMPLLGGGSRYREEYLWLWRSTQEFLCRDALLGLFREVGLQHTAYKSRMLGACVLHQGQKPPGRENIGSNQNYT